jgi:hypothetical protein
VRRRHALVVGGELRLEQEWISGGKKEKEKEKGRREERVVTRENGCDGEKRQGRVVVPTFVWFTSTAVIKRCGQE